MSMPVDSHPLSPEEITPMPRNVRQRTSRAMDPGTSRPVTSYFTLKSQSDERAAASILNWNPNNSAPNVENVTVKPSTRRPPSNPFLVLPSGSSSPEQVNGGYASKIAMAANVNGKELTNGEVTSPAMTPRAQTLVLSTEEAGITDDISSKISTTKWHAMNDDAMDEKIVQLAQRSQGAESSRQAYRSVLRILSSQLDALKATHTTCEKERANEQLKRRKVASLMRTLPPESVATVRAVLEILVETDVKETPVEGPQLAASDSLTEAIADAFTPLGVSKLADVSQVNKNSRGEDALSVLSSKTSDRDGIERGSVRSQASGKSQNSRGRPASVLGDWMGGWWRDKGRSDSSVHSGVSSREPSPGGEETERDKGTARVITKRRTLTTLGIPSWLGSAQPPKAAVSKSPERKRENRRKLSITTTHSTASIGSPLAACFQPLPTSALLPTIAPEISTPSNDDSMVSSRGSVIEPPPPPTGPHPSHIKAVSYATRVMTTDPYSILVDNAHIAPSIADLAHNLVSNLKADSSFQLREGRIGKTTPLRTPASPAATDVPHPAVAVAQIEHTESRATIVSNLNKTLNSGTLVSIGPRASAVFAGPIISPFKSRSMAPLAEPAKPPPTPGVAQPGMPAGSTVAPAPRIGTVELDSIIPVEAKPPTLYLSRTYTSSVADPTFRPSVFPSAPSRFTLKSSRLSRPVELHTDRFGFIYDALPYDVNLLSNARAANNSAPACLTGVRISDRGVDTEEDDDWWPSYEGEVPPSKKNQLKVMPEPCSCHDGIFPAPIVKEDGDRMSFVEGNNESVEGTKGPADQQHIQTDDRYLIAESTDAPPSLEPQTKPSNIDASVDSIHAIIPNHVCFNTIRVMLSELALIHDTKQKSQQAEWDGFLRRMRRSKDFSTKAVLAHASSGAAAFLGLSRGIDNTEDEEIHWTAGFGLAQLSSSRDEWKEFSKLFRTGIPLTLRSKVWFDCSGALDLMEPGTFRDLTTEAREIAAKMQRGEAKSVPLEEIEKDVTRTMPLNIFFGGDGQGVDKLRAVLGAYALRNPAVGYCQGMNLVASTLLLVLADQQEAFWVFTAIIEKVLPADFFSPSLLVSRACPMVLLDYVQDHLPNLFIHLTNLGIDLPAICFSWFLSLFTDCLPVETLFRVWDLLLCDKNGMDVLFRVSLAILKIGESDLLRCQSLSSVYSVLESLPTRMWEADRLVKIEYNLRNIVLHEDIIKRREIHTEALSQRAA